MAQNSSITIRVEEVLFNLVTQLAKQEDTTVSNILRKYLKEGLRKNGHIAPSPFKTVKPIADPDLTLPEDWAE